MERAHKVTAGFVFAFLCLHFGNHLIGLEGIDAHAQFMDAARLVYRHPIVEMLVILAFVAQILSGIALSRVIWRQKKDFIHQCQAASGTYLALFVVIHVLAVGIGRFVYNLDTNFYYAAATLMVAPWKYFFVPFYGLAILALFLHVGCIFYDIFKKSNKSVGYVFLVSTFGVGIYVAYLLLMMYSGRLYHVDLPESYTGIYAHAPSAASGSTKGVTSEPSRDHGSDKDIEQK